MSGLRSSRGLFMCFLFSGFRFGFRFGSGKNGTHGKFRFGKLQIQISMTSEFATCQIWIWDLFFPQTKIMLSFHLRLLSTAGGSIWENPWSFVCCYFCLFSSLSQTVQFHSTRSKGTNSYLTTMKFTSPIDCKRTVQNWYYGGEKTTFLAKRNI